MASRSAQHLLQMIDAIAIEEAARLRAELHKLLDRGYVPEELTVRQDSLSGQRRVELKYPALRRSVVSRQLVGSSI